MSKLFTRIADFMIGIMARFIPTCEQVSEKLSRSMDQKLSFKERVGIRIHLLGCELCRRYEKQLFALERMLRRYADRHEKDDAPIGLSPEAKAKIRHSIHQ
jgi:predicted anti-sigma-YlaC factor YlaD